MFAPGHIGELTQVIDFALVDAVLDETGTRERRRWLLPSRVVVYSVLALALFEHCSYRRVWDKLTARLGGLSLARPKVSSLSRAPPPDPSRTTAAAVQHTDSARS